MMNYNATTNMIPVAGFAPELTDAKLSTYESLINALGPGPVKDALTRCLACVKVWWGLPVSTNKPVATFNAAHGKDAVPHKYDVVLLETSHIASLDSVTPWEYELEAMKPLFEGITGELRDPAFNLLWHAMEISRDREPLTQDKLVKK